MITIRIYTVPSASGQGSRPHYEFTLSLAYFLTKGIEYRTADACAKDEQVQSITITRTMQSQASICFPNLLRGVV